MSNFPHSTASSFSTSPFNVQSNLEQLINRSRTHPNPRRPSQSSDHHGVFTGGFTAIHPENNDAGEGDDGEAGQSKSHSRRPSEYAHGSRMQTVREASYDDGAALMFDPSDDEADADADESSKMLANRRKSRRSSAGSKSSKRNYGTMSEPFAFTPAVGGHGRRKSDSRTGNSRSRSAARTPPRHTPVDGHVFSDEELNGAGAGAGQVPRPSSPSQASVAVSARGRDRDSRRLSHSTASPHVSKRRLSVSTRFADDSSGDEGGDVARGLVATGAAGMFGGAATGLGMTPAAGPVAANVLDLDPAEELDAQDLQVQTDDQGLEIRDWSQALRAEMLIVAKSSIPVFFTQLAEWSLVLSSVISIGHLGTTELAASSLASMTASVSSFSILQGLATALDTLLPAAWTSSDPSRVGLWTQRMAVVMAFSTIPMYVMWWNVERILLALGQEPDVAYLASIYLRYLSFGIPGYGGNVIVKKYLQAQNLMNIPTYVLFIVAPLNIFFNYLFVWGPDVVRLGFVGGAVATSLSYTITFLLAGGWAILYGPQEARYPWRFSHVFAKLGTVTSLGLAGTIMVSSEWWAWEACALAASLLGPVSLAAQSVLLSTTSTFFQVPAALGIASAVRTGNLLGAGRGWEAKWASRACLFLSVFFAAINSAICLIFRKNWGYLFNGDPEVVGIVASIMPYIALFQISDGVAATAGAVLRALGLHTTGALINLTSYYIIGLPFGLWLTFQPNLHLGLIGLWIGLSIALGYASVISFVLVWRANWVRAVERVRERLGLPAQGVVGEDGKWEDTLEGDGPFYQDEEDVEGDELRRSGARDDALEGIPEASEGDERSGRSRRKSRYSMNGSETSRDERGDGGEVGERTRLLNGNDH